MSSGWQLPTNEIDIASDGASGSSLTDDLATFRQQWIQELHDNLRMRESSNRAEHSDQRGSENERKNLARSLYQIGIAEERAGNPFKAVNFYARACRLFPDIDQEFRVFQDSPKSSDTTTPAPEQDDDLSLEQTSSEFACLKIRNDELDISEDESVFALCEPSEGFDHDKTHISKLPFDVMFMVLRHIAFPDFDMKSIENCGMVCKGFRLLARDPVIWRQACLQVWGDCVPPQFSNVSWREMYVKRPRLNFHGVYISKVIYTRQGEQAFEVSYNILHTVEYYRYLKFFPDGQVLMYTSPEDPKLVVPKLKDTNCRLNGIKRGQYKLQENNAVIALKDDERPQSSGRLNRNRNPQPYYENSFCLTLAISALGHKKPSCKLSWVSYSVQTKKVVPLIAPRITDSGNIWSDVTLGPVTDFNIHNAQFKPFIFSLVRSYTAVPNV
ncbi:F-box only protein 9-like [Convolutriloba macropyga]|uniref:F-box only protein 9-like n=1 Tax=Convolutriloba macropyga TaxID=536237 RepID=UPI003F526C2D